MGDAPDLPLHVPGSIPATAEVFPLGRNGLSYWVILDRRTFTPGGPVIAGGYARISRDEDKSLRGIGKQVEDNEERAAELGWTLSRLYIDDDLTAAKYGVVRPAFEQLMSDLATGLINAVLVWKSDRFARLDYDLSRLFREHALKAHTKHGGLRFASKNKVYDLDDHVTHQQLTLEVSIIGTGEVSAMRERQTREHARKAAQGQPAGGRRGFGYQATPEALVELQLAKDAGDLLRIEAANKRVWYELRYRQEPREAQALLDARVRLLAGERLATIAREWNEAGLLTPLGRLWLPSMVKNTIMSPRLASYRIHRGQVALDRHGKPVIVQGKAPIFTVTEHEEIAAFLTKRSGSPNNPAPGQRRFLLAGLLRCGLCKGPMYGNNRTERRTKRQEETVRRVYLCSGTATSCGKSSIDADQAEKHIIELVARHIDQLTPAIIGSDAPAWEGEPDLKDAETKRAMWGDKIDSGEAPEAYGFAKLTEWDSKVKDLKRDRQDWLRANTVSKGRAIDSGKDLRAMSDDSSKVDQQRAVIERYLTAIFARKITPRGPKFQPERLVPLWLEQ